MHGACCSCPMPARNLDRRGKEAAAAAVDVGAYKDKKRKSEEDW